MLLVDNIIISWRSTSRRYFLDEVECNNENVRVKSCRIEFAIGRIEDHKLSVWGVVARLKLINEKDNTLQMATSMIEKLWKDLKVAHKRVDEFKEQIKLVQEHVKNLKTSSEFFTTFNPNN